MPVLMGKSVDTQVLATILFSCFVQSFDAAQNVSSVAEYNNTNDKHCSMQQLTDTQRLQLTRTAWQELLRAHNYDTGIPPNFPHETVVEIAAFPFGLSRVDESAHTVELTTNLEMKWHDARLAYRHQDVCVFPYQNEPLYVPMKPGEQSSSEIWIPRFKLVGRLKGAAEPLLQIWSLIVSRDGDVEMEAYFTEARTCSIGTKYFPFDMQKCPLKLQVFQNVRLRKLRRQPDEEERLVNDIAIGLAAGNETQWYETSEWKLFANVDQINKTLNNPSEEKLANKFSNKFSIISYPLFLNRKYTDHVINWILSPIVLSVSSVVGMYRGCYVGERFSFGGTIVVTLTLMLGELRNKLGVGDNGYPILGQMYIGLETTLILATLLSGVPHRWVKSCNTKRCEQSDDVAVTKKLSEATCDWVVMTFILFLQTVVVVYAVIMWMT